MKWLEPFFSYGRPSSQPHCCWQWVRFIYNMTLFTWTFWLDLVLLSCWTHQMSLFFPPITNPLFSSKYYLCLCYCASSSHHHTVSNVDDPARMNFVFPLDCKSWNSRVSVHRTVAKVCLDNSLYLQRRSVRWKIPADENIYIYIRKLTLVGLTLTTMPHFKSLKYAPSLLECKGFNWSRSVSRCVIVRLDPVGQELLYKPVMFSYLCGNVLYLVFYLENKKIK